MKAIGVGIGISPYATMSGQMIDAPTYTVEDDADATDNDEKWYSERIDYDKANFSVGCTIAFSALVFYALAKYLLLSKDMCHSTLNNA